MPCRRAGTRTRCSRSARAAWSSSCPAPSTSWSPTARRRARRWRSTASWCPDRGSRRSAPATGRCSRAGRSSRVTCGARVRALPDVALRDRCDVARAARRRVARHRRAAPAACGRERRGAARGRPRRRRERARRAGAGVAGGSSAASGRTRSGSRSTSATRAGSCGCPTGALGRRADAARHRDARAAARAAPVPPGGRAPHRSRSAATAPPTGRRPTPTAFMAFVLSVAPPDVQDVLAGAEPLSDVATHALPGQRQAPLRAPRALPRRAAGVRRRDRLVQPDVRAGDVGGRRGGGHAARLPGHGRARARAAVLHGDRARGVRGRVGRSPPARTSRCRRWPDRGRSRVRILNAYLRRLRAAAVADHTVAGAFIAVIGLRRGAADAARAAHRPARRPWPAGTAGAGAPAAARDAADRRRHHAAARGRPGGRGRGGRLPPRQPRLGRRLGAAARHGRRARPSRDRVGRAGLRRRRGRLPPDRRRPRGVHRRGARRARGRARAPRAARLRRAVGPALGGRRPGAVRLRGAAGHRRAARLPLARARAGLADARASARRSTRRRPARASGC